MKEGACLRKRNLPETDRCFPQGLTHGLGKWFLATTLRVNLDLASGFVAGVKRSDRHPFVTAIVSPYSLPLRGRLDTISWSPFILLGYLGIAQLSDIAETQALLICHVSGYYELRLASAITT